MRHVSAFGSCRYSRSVDLANILNMGKVSPVRGVAGCGADLRWARCASHWSDNNTVLHHHHHPSLLSGLGDADQ